MSKIRSKSVAVSEEFWEAIKDAAAEDDRSVSSYIRVAVTERIARTRASDEN